jgi:hypothetical protein
MEADRGEVVRGEGGGDVVVDGVREQIRMSEVVELGEADVDIGEIVGTENG